MELYFYYKQYFSNFLVDLEKEVLVLLFVFARFFIFRSTNLMHFIFIFFVLPMKLIETTDVPMHLLLYHLNTPSYPSSYRNMVN